MKPASMTAAEHAAPVPEIAAPDAEIAFGRGWHQAEKYGGAVFRWAGDNAELLVATVQPVAYKLRVMLEPGPGVALKPFDLEVEIDGAPSSTVRVRGKEAVTIPLPPRRPAIHRITLRALGGGAKAPSDERTLNFRVFSIAVERAAPDVLPPHQTPGKGWYPLETFAGKRFRWVNNDAEIVLAAGGENERLAMAIEPGPGVGSKPFTLQIQRADGSTVADIAVKGFEQVDLPWPAGETMIRLHVDAPGLKSGADPRVLNFRVFAP